jgi:hypothetical protein
MTDDQWLMADDRCAGAGVLAKAGLDGYTPDRPLLLVTEYSPDATGGGAVILRGLLRAEDRARVVWLSLTRPAGGTGAGDRDGWAGLALLGRGSAGRRPGAQRSRWLDSTVLARPIAEEVLAIAGRERARAIWLVMHGAVVPLAARLTRASVLPVHLSVHDDPVGQALGSRRYLALVPWIERDVAAALRAAASVDVIAEPMAGRYRRRYRIDPVVVHRGTVGPVEPSPPFDRSRGLSVGIIGSIYDYAMIKVLGAAVARAAGWLGVPGRIVIVGDGIGARLGADLAGKGDVEVEATGHLGEPEAVASLKGCFLLYVNYPFGPRQVLFRQTSFPTKLSTYAQAARPLLIHMPADGSVAPLAAELPGYATHWGTLRADDGADLLVRLWRDPAQHESAHVPAEAVRARYYDDARNRSTLFAALNALVPAMADG